MDLPGIISDLASLIGPQLVMTIVSELLSSAISIIITQIFNSIAPDMNSFIQSLNLISYLSDELEFLNTMPTNFGTGIITSASTISNLIRNVGSLGESQSNSILQQNSQIQSRVSTNIHIDLLEIIRTMIRLSIVVMKAIQTAIQISPISKYLDILSMIMGGFMYLISPVFIERLIDGLLWFIPSIVTRLIDLYVELNENTISDNLKVIATTGSLFLSFGSWAYIMASSFGFKWGLIYKYSDRYGFLGANVISFALNSASNFFGSILEYPPIKTLILNIIYPDLTEEDFKLKIENVKCWTKIIAAIITGYLTFQTMIDHINQGDGVAVGDFLFIIQAGFIHGLLSHDKRYKSLETLWQKLGLSLESKRIKTLFGVNAALDAGMLGVFLFVT